ncbi:MAG: PAS domain-containing protein [Candidatus Heimdallarchaeota archaeon]|nr:PAS domain-containing protein [Candidatus Heimdallarchaeota archaeon]
MNSHTIIQGFKPMSGISLTESFNISENLVFILRTPNINYPPVFIEMNDLLYSMLGYTKGELLDMTLYDLIDEEDRQILDAMNKDMLDELSIEYEITLIRKDGTKMKLYVESIVFYSGTSRIECAIAKQI